MDVEVECCKERVCCERSLIKHVVAGFDEMEHGGDGVWEVIAETDAACEAMILAQY